MWVVTLGDGSQLSQSVYTAVRQRAQFRCEYCHYPELLSSAPISKDLIG